MMKRLILLVILGETLAQQQVQQSEEEHYERIQLSEDQEDRFYDMDPEQLDFILGFLHGIGAGPHAEEENIDYHEIMKRKIDEHFEKKHYGQHDENQDFECLECKPDLSHGRFWFILGGITQQIDWIRYTMYKLTIRRLMKCGGFLDAEDSKRAWAFVEAMSVDSGNLDNDVGKQMCAKMQFAHFLADGEWDMLEDGKCPGGQRFKSKMCVLHKYLFAWYKKLHAFIKYAYEYGDEEMIAGRQLRVNPVLRETFDEIIHEIEDIIQKFTATPSLDLDHLMSYYAQLQQEQQILMKAIQDNDPKEFQGIAESQATMMGVIQVVNDPKTQRGFQVMMIQLAIEIEKILDKIHWDDLQALGADDVNHQHDFQTFGVHIDENDFNKVKLLLNATINNDSQDSNQVFMQNLMQMQTVSSRRLKLHHDHHEGHHHHHHGFVDKIGHFFKHLFGGYHQEKPYDDHRDHDTKAVAHPSKEFWKTLFAFGQFKHEAEEMLGKVIIMRLVNCHGHFKPHGQEAAASGDEQIEQDRNAWQVEEKFHGEKQPSNDKFVSKIQNRNCFFKNLRKLGRQAHDRNAELG